jgi:hypothetical protein
MTIAERELKIEQLQVEINVLRNDLLRMKGIDVMPGIGPIGTFKDDPTFADAVRFGREYREPLNRASLEEMDREAAQPKLTLVLDTVARNDSGHPPA